MATSMTNITSETIQDTIQFWSAKAGYEISEGEAAEIILNLVEYFDVLSDMANSTVTEIGKKLIDEATFTKVGAIDRIVPHVPGLYCVRLVDGAELPERYQHELKKQNSRLIYIGKAERSSLHKRFLQQELRAKGHGTFFRSVGAMLGYTPLPGSLKDKSNQNNYTFSKTDKFAIINWMNSNFEASWVAFEGPFLVEKYLIRMHSPLLNIDDNPQCLTLLKNDRDRCRQIALK